MALPPVTRSRGATRTARPGQDRLWTVIAAVEVVAAVIAVLLDLVVTTLVLPVMLGISLAVRRRQSRSAAGVAGAVVEAGRLR